MPNKLVTLTEVFWRETIQNIKSDEALAIFDLGHLVYILEELKASGITSAELTSFIDSKNIPAMKGQRVIDTITRAGKTPEGSEYITLVMPHKGDPIAKHLNGFLSFNTDAHALGHTAGLFTTMVDEFAYRNLGMSADTANTFYTEFLVPSLNHRIPYGKERGIPFVVYFSAAFGYKYNQGDDNPMGLEFKKPNTRDLKMLARKVKQYIDLGAKRVSLADTQNCATPEETSHIIQTLKSEGVDISKIAYHLHTNSVEDYLKLIAAYDGGVRHFDTSLGWAGGGCPRVQSFGNYPTIAAIGHLRDHGARIDVNLDRLRRLDEWIRNTFQERLEHAGYKL